MSFNVLHIGLDADFEFIQKQLRTRISGMRWLTYSEEGREIPNYDGVGVQPDVVLDIIRRHGSGLDFVFVDGLANYHMDLARQIRSSGYTSAPTVDFPIFASMKIRDADAADFGIQNTSLSNESLTSLLMDIRNGDVDSSFSVNTTRYVVTDLPGKKVFKPATP